MKQLFRFWIAAALLIFAGCVEEYDDSALVGRVDDLESRVQRLEQLCQQMNTNISSLQTIVTALQNNDYVTGVTPITENGKTIGYTITFAKAQSITIYHGKDGQNGADGKDGQDGADGKDGYTPIIGVRQDTDGIYYWTLDGEWLRDNAGNRIKAVGTDGKEGVDGATGPQGPQGEPGKDGITPMLKIEDDYWYVSYDNGASWNQLGKATGKDGKDGSNGVDGTDGKDGDSIFHNVRQDENNVYFTLANGTEITIPKVLALSIKFYESDLVVMSPNTTREIGYTVTSATETVKVEVTSSADIKAKAVADNASGLTGKIHITTGDAIDEYSKVIVFVSNGDKVIMRSITFEEAGLVVEENTTKQATAEGGEVILEFLSNVGCEVVIPEDAQSWISVVPATRAMEKQTITLKLAPNEGHNRSTTVTVQSPDGTLKLQYKVEQEGNLGIEIDPTQIPDNEIWYRTADKQIYDIYHCTNSYGHQPFDVKVISNTYQNGYGVIKLDAPVTNINDFAFTGANITELYLPDCIEYIGTGAINRTGLTTLRIPKNLKSVGPYGLYNPNLVSFTGYHISEDGRCVIIEDCFMPDYGNTLSHVKNYMAAFAPAGITEYTLPDNVEILGVYAFAWCSGLRKITFNEGLKVIGTHAFCDCVGLNSVTFPSSLEQLASPVFDGCSNINGFYGNEKFHSSDNKCLYYIPSSFESTLDPSTQSGPYLVHFADSSIEEYTIPEGIIGINGVGFNMAKNLKRLTLPNSLTWVNSHAFTGCDKLEAVYGEHTSIDNKCIVIDNSLYAYVARDGVTNYIIPDNITSIQSEAFSSISSTLEHISMSDNVTEIADYSFAWMESLKSITLSANLKKIGVDRGIVVGPDYNPFLESNNLESIYFRSLVPPTYADTQMSEWNKLTVYVPKGCLEVYKSSGWSPFAKYMKEYEYTDLPFDYISSDYSQDGKVTALQMATVGEGIDVVLMGDGYSDRQIADGTYKADMENLYNNLFTEEPYKSFKDHFNVYYVNVVSVTEGYEHGGAALGGYFGNGTLVGGNDNAVFDYALNTISEEEMDEALLIVAMNSDNYAGTCYMYYPETNADYGNGVSVSYFPKGGDATTFAQLLHHEACGHGFAKLADEYAYEGMGAAPSDYVSEIQSQQANWGWWKNVDFTSDPTATRWSYFVNDTRYANEGLGAYEGGLTYWTGVWRPTENSIMRYNTGGFNAPSREAIYYRIHKLAYGDSWEYDYEDFVEWDARNRTTAATRAMVYKPANYKPTHPPVIVNKSWKDAK